MLRSASPDAKPGAGGFARAKGEAVTDRASQEEVLAFLSRRESHGNGTDPVGRIDTHISSVFLVGDRAYKLKRAVDLGYLDFSTVERRRAFCERELAANRRTAKGLYEGVLPITRQVNGQLALGGDGEAVDWVVAMRRFPSGATLDQIAARGELDAALARRLADAIAAFHRGLPPVADAEGARAMTAVLAGNIRALAAAPPCFLDPASVACVIARQRVALARCADLLDRRAAAGRVRRCHGDLHLRNIVLLEGAIVPFDAIEFDEALATIDVLYDLAFLVMDLGFRDRRDAANLVLNRYLDVTVEGDGLAAVPFFLSTRAVIRAHVDATMAAGAPPEEAERLGADARRYLARATEYLDDRTPRLIAIGGLSGSGKSRLARGLAPRIGTPPGARVVRSDVLRKRLAGVAPEDRLDETHYTEESSRAVYAALFREADDVLAAGWSVIADAVFARGEERDQIAAVARARGVPFDGLWLEAPLTCLEARVARRKDDASDASAAVVRRQATYDLGELMWRRVDSGSSPDTTLAAAARALTLEIA